MRIPSVFSNALLCGMLLAGVAGRISAADWPHFLGPTANGVSSETGLIDSIPTNGPSRVWSKDIGTGYSAPSVRAGQLVLHHRLKDEEIIEAFDAVTGAPKWRYAYPSKFQDPYGYNNGPRCSPLLTDTKCFTLGAEGKLLCLDVKTGKKIWERDTEKEWEIPSAFFGVGSTPLLEGNVLVVMLGGQPNSGVVGFDAETGKTLWESVGEKSWQGQPMIGWPGERTVAWKRYEKQASYASPIAATIHGQRHLFCLMRQGLVSLNPTNGAVNFSFWFRSQLNDSVNATTPVIVDDTVFISAAYYRVGSVLLKVNPDGKGVKELWRSTALELHWSNPIYLQGYLYGFSGRNEPDSLFRCVEYKTGKVMWSRDERWRGHEPTSPTFGRGSMILADGKLIALGEAGLLGIFRPNPEKVEELSRWQVPDLHYPCWAGPVLSDKKLYLRSENKLICFELTKK